MTNARFRLAVFDFDNTLVDADLALSPRLRHALLCAQKKGTQITIATGRGPDPVSRFVDLLGIQTPVIYMQGGLIFDHQEKTVLLEQRIPLEEVAGIEAIAAVQGWNLMFSTMESICLSRSLHYKPRILEILGHFGYSWVPSFSQGLKAPPYKFMIAVEEPDQRAALADALMAIFPAENPRISILPSHPLLVEGVPKNVNKARAVEWLSRRLGISAKEIMAVGDNDNDVEMLAWAGMGVAMGDATPAARAVAKDIVPSVKEEGAAIAVEKWLLS